MNPSPSTLPESLSGLIERVTFFTEENGFGVLQVKAKGHRDLVTVVGSLPSVRAGEWVHAQGRWVQDREFGLQFKAEMLNSTAPTTKEGIEKYLGSGMVKGIGPVYAKKRLAGFGYTSKGTVEPAAQGERSFLFNNSISRSSEECARLCALDSGRPGRGVRLRRNRRGRG